MAKTDRRRPVARKILRQPRAKNVRIKSKMRATISYSRKFKFFVRGKRALLKTFSLIEKNLDKLKAGAVINSSGIRIEKAYTGSHEGKHNILTMKVTFAGRRFFVKKCSPNWAKENLYGAKATDAYLRESGYKVWGFNVRVLFPHLVYERQGKGYVVSDYFKPREVKQVPYYRGPKFEEIHNVLKFLNKALGGPMGYFDIIAVNAFYQRSTNTILLFDLAG